MLDVFITVDVEIWCNGWVDIDKKFPSAFRRYIHGQTSRGGFGLPYQLDVLKSHGLAAVHFVEPLFSTRFGSEPLQEIVGLICAGGQEVQLHIHTEWVDEALQPLLASSKDKRQHMFMYSRDDQTRLIAKGAALLADAGAESINAFRAGSFGFNIDTLRALAANGIAFDSSYNATMFGPQSGVMPNTVVVAPIDCEGVHEYPMSVFADLRGSLRHAQLTACSFAEMEHLLWQALERGDEAFVILSHNFELLSPSMEMPDDVMVARYRKLCSFLDKNRDVFRTRGFHGLLPRPVANQPLPLKTTLWHVGARMCEQAYRRKFR